MKQNHKQFSSLVMQNNEVSPGTFHMRLEAPFLSQNVHPGQFIMIKTSDMYDPLLRRPFSLCGADENGVDILFQVRGKGTDIMSGWEQGHEVSIIGPIGNCFNATKPMRYAYLIAGGIGIAPLLFLRKLLKEKGSPVKIFYGGKSEKDILPLEYFNLNDSDVFIATEDGSRGFQGFVTDLLLDYMNNNHQYDNSSYMFGCGPVGMAKMLTQIASTYKAVCQISLEEHMACGTGACLGCVVSSRSGLNSSKEDASSLEYKRVCVDGPVFQSDEIEWK
jgi:dihydroorotate dehydrogenase electron transfer subunit